MRNIMIATAVTGLTLTGCATNPQTGQPQMSQAAVGALIGAASGALIDKDKRGRGALIGAAIGGGVGYYMQQQEEKLRAQTAGTGIDLKRDPNTNEIDIIMPGSITFATNSSDITNRFTPTLNKVASTLKEYDKTNIVVKGFTDNVGNAGYNQKLSEKRAYSVANYLANNGVLPNRIRTRGYGMNNPVASNDTAAGRSQNRRVEITLLPPKEGTV